MSIASLFKQDSDSDFWETVSKTLNTTATFTRNEKTRRVILGASAAVGIVKAVNTWRDERRSNEIFTINIFENDPLFDKVNKWLTNSIDDSELRSVTASTLMDTPMSRAANSAPDDLLDMLDDDDARPVIGSVPSDSGTKKKALDIFYDGSRSQEIVVDGHKVLVRINNPAAGSEREGKARSSSIIHITIQCYSLEAKNAVLCLLDKEARSAKERRPYIYGAMQWGNFRQIGQVPHRPLSSVVLKQGQSERILNDLRDFLKRETEYGLLGMPYRRGVLLEGAPGTGKSSVATALAHELKMDVFIINVSAIQSDNDLMDLITDIRAGSILLLEDIDVANSVKNRTDEQNGVSMSGILNALDGIATPHGIITILTTNHADVIDPAILRAGRVDLREQIGYIDDYQVRQLCRVFLGFVPEDLPTIYEEDEIVAASVVECFKKNLDDKDAAARDLVSMLVLSSTKVRNLK